MSDRYLPDNEPRDILLSLEELAVKKMPHAPTFRKAADEITRLRAELAAAIAERDRLREALKPFAEVAKHDISDDDPDDDRFRPMLTYNRAPLLNVGHFRRARAALDGTEPVSPWRDIESAPKDGTKFLAWFPWPVHHKVEIAYWDTNKYAKNPKPYWSCDTERIRGVATTRSAQPTHWMPLPEPPR